MSSEDFRNQIITDIFAELRSAEKKYPGFPSDPLHALAIVGEEFGELNKAVLQMVYEPHKTSVEDVRTEAIQTAAMSLRFLFNFKNYNFKRKEAKSAD